MSNALVPVTGEPGRWARDFAAIGPASGLLAPFALLLFAPAYPLLAALVGGAGGWLLGRTLAPTLERVRGRVPLPLLGLAALPVGALWGGLAGFVAGLPFELGTALLGGAVAAVAGAA